MNKSKFSLTLKKLRVNANLTQKQMAEALSIERSTYAYYETGNTQPNAKMILNLAKILKVDYKIFMEAINDGVIDDNYTTLTDTSYKEREQIYRISKDEQSILLAYRMMNDEKKKALFDLINERNENKGDTDCVLPLFSYIDAEIKNLFPQENKK